MPDPDHDTRPERRPDPRFDDWPVTGYDAYQDWQAQRATPRDEDGTLHDLADEAGDESLSWIGVAGAGSQGGTPMIYATGESAVYEGEFDEEDARIVIREERKEDVESDESLGEHIEEIGEDHGWHWLSSFAREHLEDDRAEELTHGRLELRETEFDRKEVLDSAPADMAFHGAHTLADSTGRVHVLERRFTVPDARSDPVPVEVEEYYKVAEAPRETDRAGDADILEKREYSLEREVDPDVPKRAVALEETLRAFHESNVGWPGEETGSPGSTE